MTRAADGLGLGLGIHGLVYFRICFYVAIIRVSFTVFCLTAIASELATKKLRTQISVVSVMGHGSTFSFEVSFVY